MGSPCRLCRSPGSFLQSIFDFHAGHDISEVVMEICCIKIDPDDSLPKVICDECLEIVISAKTLKEKSIESDEFYRSKSLNASDRSKKVQDSKSSVIVLDSGDDGDENPIQASSEEPNTSSHKFSCGSCDFTWNSQQVVDIHTALRHASTSTDPAPTTKTKKIKKIAKEKPVRAPGRLRTCNICHKNFPSVTQCTKHKFRDHHKIYRDLKPDEATQTFICCRCDTTFEDEPQLLTHAETHRKNYASFKCLRWGKIIKNFAEFLVHLQLELQPTNVFCLICSKNFCSGPKFVDHCRNHVRVMNAHICDHCGARYQSKIQIELHIRIKHLNETLFMCPHCGMSLASKEILQQHIKLLHEVSEGTFECKMCLRKFSTEKYLKAHEEVHKNEKTHKCDFCDEMFKHKSSKYYHTYRYHKKKQFGQKRTCKICDFTSNSKYRMNRHLDSHSGIKPHQCEYCDKAYLSKGDLTKHLRVNHIGDSIYKCNKCPETFRYLKKLHEHQSVHD